MKKFFFCLILLGLALLSNFQNLNAQNVNVSGAIVGNGTYLDLGSAFTAINSGGQAGASIIVSVVANTTEPVTATLNQGAWVSLSILPVGGVPRTISGNIVGPLIDFNSADRVVVDGLNVGGNALIIENTNNTAASTIRFINDSRSVFVQNSTILGAGTSVTTGTIFISTSAGGGGNDSIAFNTCTIGASGANFPTNGVYSSGTFGQENSSIGFNTCNIPNFFNATAISRGIFADAGNTDWIIQGCKFYQAASRTYTAANTHRAIQVNSGNNHSISGNTIGFATSGGTGAYTMQGLIATRFIAIDLGVGTLIASSVQGNTISAIGISTTSGATTLNGVLCGINITSGNVNVGSVTPNIIGGNAGIDLFGSITSTSGALVVGINSSSTGTIVIQNNIIGGLTSTALVAAVAGSVTAVNVSGSALSMTIAGNTIGNATANNMRGGTLGLTTAGTLAIGINTPSTLSTALVISSNTIQNFSAYGTATTAIVRGIVGNALNAIVSGNIIRNLTTASTMVGYTSGSVGALGILVASGTNTVINQNTISNISNTNTGTGNFSVLGISCAAATNTTVSNNTIYDLSNAGTGTTVTAPPVIAGVLVRSGTTAINIYNNMISLGTGQTTNTAILGIVGNHGSAPDPTVRIYHNTINIAGTVGVGALPSFGIARTDFTATARTAPFDVKNNIVTNTRTGGTGFHFAIANNYGALTSSVTGWPANASNNNVLNANAANVGWWSNVNQTFVGWQTASSSDAVSYSGITVTYVNPANDLHLNMGVTPTFIESGGQTIAMVPTDIDAQNRPGPAGSVNGGATAPDLGADEIDGAPVVCVSASGGTITPTTYTRCENQTQLLTSVGATAGFGITYQWKVSATPGGPYANVTGGTGATTTSYTTGPLAAGTFYYVLETTCSAGPLTGLSNEVTVTVNPAPSISVTPTSGNICQPGGTAIPLTASGTSVSYAWLPVAGLTPATGTNVSALPTATTTYTVTGTDGIGCTNSATAVISVFEIPSITGISATPNSVCSGANSQLQVDAGLTTAYTISNITYSANTTPGAGVTTLANASVAVTALSAGNLDDGVWQNQTLPFAFSFFGTSYTSFAVSTNGFMVLGAGAPNTFTSYGIAFPSLTPGRPSIGATYSDLDFRTIGTIEYFTLGVAPNRAFVINWKNGNFYNAVGAINTQMIIYETTNIIEVHTTNSSGTNAAVEGIQNASGTTAYTVAGRNNVTWPVVIPDAYRWSPSGTPVTYAWSPATFLSSTTISNPMANAITSTTTYTVTVSNGGCSTTASTTITSGTALTSSAITTNSPVCQGADIIATANPSGGGAPYTYSWTVDGGAPFTSPTATVTLSGLTSGPHTIISTVTDACSATTMQSTSVTVNTRPTVSVSTTPAITSVCVGSTYTLTGNGASAYTWSPSTFLSAVTGTNVNVSGTVTNFTPVTYTIIGTDLNGCIDTATQAVTLAPPHTMAVTNSGSPICAGTTVNLALTDSVVLTGPTSLPVGYCAAGATTCDEAVNAITFNTISNTSGCTGGYANNTTISTSVVPGSSYPISITTTAYYTGDQCSVWFDWNRDGDFGDAGETYVIPYSGAGGIFSSSVLVPVAASYGATVMRVRMAYTGLVDPCGIPIYGEVEDYKVILEYRAVAPGANTYVWSPVTTPATGTAVSDVPTNTTLYTVTGTDAIGCTVTGTTNIVVNPLPTPTASNTGAYCAGTTIQLSSPTGSVTDDWTGPGGYVQNDTQNPTIASSTVAMSGVYTVTVTNGSGCSATATTTVLVNTLPTASATNTGPYCVGATIQLNSVGGSATDDWSGPSSYSVTNVQNPTIPASTVAMDGVYTVTVTDINSCSATATTTVVVSPLPAPTATNTGPYCVGSTIQLNSPTGYATDDWTGPLSYTATNIQNPTIASSTVAMSGDYTVTVTAPGGCSATATTTVVVNALPTPTASNTGPYCEGSTIQLNSPTGSATDDWSGPSSYSVVNVQNPTIASSTVAMSGVYTVTVTNGSGCSATATTTVVVNALPSPTANNTGPYCPGATIQLNSPTGSAADDWTGPLSYAQNNTQNPTIASSTVAMSGDYTVTVTNGSGCSATATTTVVVNPLPTPTASNTGPYCVGSTIQLNSVPSSATDDWTGPLSYTSIDVANPTISSSTVAMSGVYTVTVTNAAGCSATATTTVAVNPYPVVNLGPDVVQPNPPAILDAGAGFGSYLWSTTEVTQTISINTNGQYIVSVTTAGCSDSDTINVNFTSGIVNVNGSTTTMKLYPNPTSGPFSVQIDNLETNNLTIDILDMTGRVVYTRFVGSVSGNVIEAFDMTTLRMGAYTIRMTANGKSNQLRFVINQ